MTYRFEVKGKINMDADSSIDVLMLTLEEFADVERITLYNNKEDVVVSKDA